MMMDKKELFSMIEIQLKSFIDFKRPKDAEVRKKLDFVY